MAQTEKTPNGILGLEKADDNVYLLVESSSAAGALDKGDLVVFGGREWRVTNRGRKYFESQQTCNVCRVYVTAPDDIVPSGGATAAQIVALRNWGVTSWIAAGASREVASSWLCDLAAAGAHDRSVGGGGDEVARVLRRINTIRE